MLFGKLWVRIKGEFLALKDDLTGEWEGQDKALEFLEKLERRFREPQEKDNSRDDPVVRLDRVAKKIEQGRDAGPEDLRRQERAPKSQGAPSTEELEKLWEELRSLREKRKTESLPKERKGPNPRRLG
jgi:predicted  nucleic acid-binding Zn-ribbon protein